jgi:hypothetical protein
MALVARVKLSLGADDDTDDVCEHEANLLQGQRLELEESHTQESKQTISWKESS